jgi:hypothetical protein
MLKNIRLSVSLGKYSLGLIFCALLAACDAPEKKEFTVEKTYSYIIDAQIGGVLGEFISEYTLRRKSWRLRQFRHIPEREGTVMYAYHINEVHHYNEQTNQRRSALMDTVEVAVTAFQADSLFSLAKAVIESVQIDNIDTVYAEPGVNAYSTDQDVTSGWVRLAQGGQEIRVNVGALYAGNNRSATKFNALYHYFVSMFPKR